MGTKPQVILELACAFAQEDVNDLRRLVERLHRRRGSTEADVARMALTAHELLENAVKFSIDGAASLRIVVDANGETELVTRNRAAAKDRAMLARFAAELESATDPGLFYQSLMARAPKQPGGLGIGRVLAEADMQVGFVFQDDVVEVHARAGHAAGG